MQWGADGGWEAECLCLLVMGNAAHAAPGIRLLLSSSNSSLLSLALLQTQGIHVLLQVSSGYGEVAQFDRTEGLTLLFHGMGLGSVNSSAQDLVFQSPYHSVNVRSADISDTGPVNPFLDITGGSWRLRYRPTGTQKWEKRNV